jgi:hypothetical protein
VQVLWVKFYIAVIIEKIDVALTGTPFEIRHGNNGYAGFGCSGYLIPTKGVRAMQPHITVEKDYILVEPLENEYLEIVGILSRLFKMPEYLQKDVIWKFHTGPLKAAYEDLYAIKAFIKRHYPEGTKPDKKVAIVVETGLFTAIAKEYVKIVKDLSPEFKVFSDLSEAIDWIAGS